MGEHLHLACCDRGAVWVGDGGLIYFVEDVGDGHVVDSVS